MTWNVATLGEIAEREGGLIQTGPFGSQLHQSDYVPDGIPVIMPKDITDGRVDAASVARVSEETANRLSRHQLRPRTIVLPRRGEITKRAFIRGDQAGWLCGTGCLQIALDGKHLLPEFLYYYMEQEGIVRWLEQHAVGTTMLNLSTGIVTELPLKYPMLPAQQRIADILSAYDDLIENNRRRMALLEDAARHLYREWFVRLRFPGHEHTRITNAVPEGWEKRRVEDLAELKGGKQLESESITEEGPVPVYGGNGVQGYTTGKTHHGFVIAFGRVGANCGSVHWSYDGAWVNNNASGVVPSEYPELFLHHLLNFDFTNLRKGAAQPFIPNRVLATVEFWGAPRTIAELFCEAVRPLRLQQANFTRANQKLRAARNLLLPRLMNGEIAV